MILNIFTIPDPDLSQESSVDPMGLQVNSQIKLKLNEH
jgi:hypothetical protein